MTLVEAMSHDCPVVSFDCDFGPREIIEDSWNGLLVDDGDIGGLADAVTRIVDDTERRKRLVAAGRERVIADEVGSISDNWIRVMEVI